MKNLIIEAALLMFEKPTVYTTAPHAIAGVNHLANEEMEIEVDNYNQLPKAQRLEVIAHIEKISAVFSEHLAEYMNEVD